MSMFGKIKNILFTEEDETEEIPVIKETPIPEVHEEKPTFEDEIARFKNFNYEEKVNPIPFEEEKVEEVKEEIPVKKEEKSPFQSFDEEEFDRVAAFNKNRLLERDRKLREEKERKREHLERNLYTKPVEKEQPKFVPSPVISPVYGILDKNYTKDDILPRASSEGTLPKVMDVDQVRKKAFGTLESLEKNITNDLDDIKITSFEDQVDDDVVISNKVEEITVEDTKPLPKVEETTVEEENEDTKPLPKVEEVNIEEEIEDTKPLPEIENEVDEVKKEEEDIDNDLFELIDSMYNDEEGEK